MKILVFHENLLNMYLNYVSDTGVIMRIFYRYGGSRFTADVPEECSVGWLKEQIKSLHGLAEVSALERPVLTLLFAGSDLKVW